MPTRIPPQRKTRQTPSVLPVSALPRFLEAFLMAGDVSQHSERTLGNRRERIEPFIAWCESSKIDSADTQAVRSYLHYLRHKHEAKKGQPPPLDRYNKPLKPLTPGTIKTRYGSIRTFFNWLVKEGEVSESPTDRVDVPIDRPDEIQPFSREQTRAMLKAAQNPGWLVDTGREEAIFLVLLDTGIRSEELRSLLVGDVDALGSQLHIRNGKGGKGRFVPISARTRRVVLGHVKYRQAEDEELLFVSQGGNTPGNFLGKGGLDKMVKRWGEQGGVSGVRCSPHTFRHTMAIEFLRAGGDVFTLKKILGHNSLTMVNRYVALAQADVNRKHAQCSPVSQLLKKR